MSYGDELMAGPPSVRLESTGAITLRYLNELGQRVTLDLSAEIERIAEAKVAEHMRKWHGHQL